MSRCPHHVRSYVKRSGTYVSSHMRGYGSSSRCGRDPYDSVPYVSTRVRTPEEKAEDKRRNDRENRMLTAFCGFIFFFLPMFLVSAFFAAALGSAFMWLVAFVLIICATATFMWARG